MLATLATAETPVQIPLASTGSARTLVAEHSSEAGFPVDAELERRIVNYLVARHEPGLRGVVVQVDRGAVTLRGTVATFYQKQLCAHCSLRVAGVRRVVDLVHVRERA